MQVVTHRLYSAPRNKFSGFLHTLHSAKGRRREREQHGWWVSRVKSTLSLLGTFQRARLCILPFALQLPDWQSTSLRAQLTGKRPLNSSVTKHASTQSLTAVRKQSQARFGSRHRTDECRIQDLTKWGFEMLILYFWRYATFPNRQGNGIMCYVALEERRKPLMV